MEEKIRHAVQDIIHRKTQENEAFPCAHSIEVAQRLRMNARELEVIIQGMPDITAHLTINGTFYEM